MKKAFKILGIILGIFVCGVVVIVGLGAIFIATAKDIPVTDNDREIVVTAIDLIPYFEDYSPVEGFESFEKVRYIDDSEELSYEYDSTNEDDPYIAVTVTRDQNMSDANSTYSIEWTGQRLGINLADSGVDLEENSSFYSAGDRSRFGTITYAGQSVGHILVMQKGLSVYSFTISGFLIDDPTVWHDLFDERIANLE